MPKVSRRSAYKAIAATKLAEFELEKAQSAAHDAAAEIERTSRELTEKIEEMRVREPWARRDDRGAAGRVRYLERRLPLASKLSL